MCLLSHSKIPRLAPTLVEDERDVTASLLYRCGAAVCARAPARERRCFVHECALDVQAVDVDGMAAVFGVRESRAQRLRHDARSFLRHHVEKLQRVLDVPAAHEVDDETRLAR